MREEGMNELGEENDGDEIESIETLPDNLLINILSCLDTKEAAMTSVLSKRWRYIWTETSSLSFYKSTFDIRDTRKLVIGMRTALFHRTCSYLDRLCISFTFNNHFPSDVNAWVEFAVRNKVKELWLQLHSGKYISYTIPEVMYSCCSFTVMWLKGCSLESDGTIDWKCLTELHIDGVELHKHVIQKILSSCPVLSSFYLTDCYGFERLDIDSQSLHCLSSTACEDQHSVFSIEISAPYLHQLFLSQWKVVRLPNIQSLSYAEIQFDGFDVTEEDMTDMMVFFDDISHVKELKLGYQCIEVLSKLAENGCPLPKSTRERLTIETFRYEYSIPAILELLESSPELESLVVLCYDDFAPQGSTWDLVGWDDLACDLPHLKTVELSNYADPNLSGEPLLTMGRILLKRATTLEKMVFYSTENLTEPFIAEISKELHSYPRSSQKALVVFH